jgi:hypothetical protein
VGETLGPAARFDEAKVKVGDSWVPLAAQKLTTSYRHSPDGVPEDDEVAEWVVPVRWIQERPTSAAFRKPGMFASTHSACKLRQEYTLELLADEFGLSSDDE